MSSNAAGALPELPGELEAAVLQFRGEDSAPLDLSQVLQLVSDTIVESLGFEVAVVNLVDGNDMVVAAGRSP